MRNNYLWRQFTNGANWRHTINNIKVLSVSWTGIAAILLKGGRTSHAAFKVTLDIDKSYVSNINLNTPYAEYLEKIQIIIWDKITIATKYAFETVHNFVTDLHGNKKPGGNVIMILYVDFRQTFPIVKHGSRSQIMENTVKKVVYGPVLNNVNFTCNV